MLRAQPVGPIRTPVADIAGFEADNNPDGAQIDSNPNSVVTTSDRHVVADAGGNALIEVSPEGTMPTQAVFPAQPSATPPAPGADPPFAVESVPISVVRGPDGAFYVGELTGFPFPPGVARLYRVEPGEQPDVVADGFTNVIDVAFTDDGSLYVLEIAHNGLLSGDPTGALIRVEPDGTHEVIASDGLTYPAGLALHDSSAYVSNCGICSGDGSIVRIPLPQRQQLRN